MRLPASVPLVTAERARFLVVGFWNTVFGFGVFASLQLTIGDRVGYLGVLGISHVVGVLNAYFFYRRFVFRVKGHVIRDLLRFWSVYIVGLGLNAAQLAFLVEVCDLPVLLAQALTLFTTVCLSYVGHKFFSFRRPAHELSRPL